MIQDTNTTASSSSHGTQYRPQLVSVCESVLNPDALPQLGRIGQVVKVVLVDQFNFASQDVVWMNGKDLEDLFAEVPSNAHNTETRKYVRLGDNMVYRVRPCNISQGMIGLNSHQKEAISKSIFAFALTPHCFVVPYAPEELEINKAAHVDFEINPYKEGSAKRKNQSILYLHDLSADITKLFAHTFITHNQQLLVEYRHEQFILAVREISPMRFERFGNRHWHGYITPMTKFSFNIKPTLGITLTDQIITKDIAHAFFQVKLPTKYLFDNLAGMPVLVDMEKLSDRIYTALAGRHVILGHKFTVHLDQLPIKCILERIEMNGKSYSQFNVIKNKPQIAFRFDMRPPVIFNRFTHNIQLIKEGFNKAKAIDFEIISLGEDHTVLHSNDDMHWINAGELKKQIAQIKNGICHKQIIRLMLDGARISLRVVKGFAADPSFTRVRKSGRDLWTIDENTEIRIGIHPDIKIPLVDTKEPKDATEVEFHILPRCNETANVQKLEIEENEVLEAIKKKATGPFARKQEFEISLKNLQVRVVAAVTSFNPLLYAKPVHGTLVRLTHDTRINIQNNSKDLTIVKPLVQEDFKLENYGIAAMDKEFEAINTCFCLPRKMPAEAKMLKITIERGLLLYGPPGTGKTQMAEIIAKKFGCTVQNGRFVKINGADVKKKWVGSSEGNTRALFKNAIEDNEKYGENSELHIIFIDEADAILATRKDDSSSRVDEGIVNTILSYTDGIYRLPNLMIIASTNRKDLLDPAVLRFGRFGMQLEFPNPDADKRKEIFDLHAKNLKDIGWLAGEVDMKKLADLTKDFSGADIAQVLSKVNAYILKRLSAVKEGERKNAPKRFATDDDFIQAIQEIQKQKTETSKPPPPDGMYQ